MLQKLTSQVEELRGERLPVAGVVGEVVGVEEVVVEPAKVEGVVAGAVPGGSEGSVSDVELSSWSDDVESESAGRADGVGGLAGVSGGGKEKKEDPEGNVPVMSYRDALGTSFGGADLGMAVVAVGSGDRFFAEFVNTPAVRVFAGFLHKMVGQVIPKKARGELALVMYTAATVPASFVNGRARLRGLAMLGDAAMAVAMVNAMYNRGTSVAGTQELKSHTLSASSLAAAGEKSGLSNHFVFGAGVSKSGSRTAAEAVEAVAGLLYRWRPGGALVAYMRALGLDV